jgi:hypothetical protein
MKEEIVTVYMNDLVILAESLEQGIERLKMVLSVSSQYGLNIKWKKCKLLSEEITFLGYKIRGGKVSPSDEKILAVK